MKTQTAHEQYSLRNSKNLHQPIQMQLPKKQKYFSELFGPLLKSALNFEHFEKKDEAHS